MNRDKIFHYHLPVEGYKKAFVFLVAATLKDTTNCPLS